MRSSVLSLKLPGSPSVALITTTHCRLRARAAATVAWSLRADREGGAAAAAQVDLLGHGDELVGGEPGQLAEDRLIGVEVDVLHSVEASEQPRLPDGQGLRRWRRGGHWAPPRDGIHSPGGVHSPGADQSPGVASSGVVQPSGLDQSLGAVQPRGVVVSPGVAQSPGVVRCRGAGQSGGGGCPPGPDPAAGPAPVPWHGPVARGARRTGPVTRPAAWHSAGHTAAWPVQPPGTPPPGTARSAGGNGGPGGAGQSRGALRPGEAAQPGADGGS